jgi:MYXO-CTERM domain-containing protein
LLTLIAGTAGCTDDESAHQGFGTVRSPLAHPGPWEIPAETLAIGDTQFVDYTGAGDWKGESGCGGGILPGTDVLRQYLYVNFPQTHHIGGYSCRPINGSPSKMSVHATGRALDIMLHTIDGEADNDIGDPIGNWLIENAEAIGIQYIIWDLYSWNASRDPGIKDKPYGGAHPHDDHLHIELSVEKSEKTENWFEDAVEQPKLPGCDPMPADGALIEETDACFLALGPTEFWRVEDGSGHGGGLIWTNAFESDDPSNWARWNFEASVGDAYRIEAYIEPGMGVHRDTVYGVHHAGGDSEVVVDQSAQDGWVELGVFELAAGERSFVDVFDATPAPVEDDQRIVVDALRVSRLEGKPPTGQEPPVIEGRPDDEDPTDDSAWIRGEASASCAMGAPTPKRGAAGWWLALAGLALGVSRRRKR